MNRDTFNTAIMFAAIYYCFKAYFLFWWLIIKLAAVIWQMILTTTSYYLQEEGNAQQEEPVEHFKHGTRRSANWN